MRTIMLALCLLLLCTGSTVRAEENIVPAPPVAAEVKESTKLPSIEKIYDNEVGTAIIRCPTLPPRPFDFRDVPAEEIGRALLDEDSIKAAWDEKFGKEKPRRDFHAATDQAFIKAGKCTGGALYIVLYSMKGGEPRR